MRREFLINALEAAEVLGISFTRFKVAIWRGLGHDPIRRPTGKEAHPVVGDWSARSAKYRASDIRRMHEEYPFRANRTPNHKWFRTISQPVVPQFAYLLEGAAKVLKTPKKRANGRKKTVRPVRDEFLFDWLANG
jgi:hypothetical protein